MMLYWLPLANPNGVWAQFRRGLDYAILKVFPDSTTRGAD
jgi:hypothetical protein